MFRGQQLGPEQRKKVPSCPGFPGFSSVDLCWNYTRNHFNLAIDGGPRYLRRRLRTTPNPTARSPRPGAIPLLCLVSCDKKGTLTSESIHQFGSAALDHSSPHYADQSPLFVAMKTKPVLFTQTQLGGHIEADYRPGEAGAVVAAKD
jgi:penicillin amidase/acyl-homoserine-lactone acylase